MWSSQKETLVFPHEKRFFSCSCSSSVSKDARLMQKCKNIFASSNTTRLPSWACQLHFNLHLTFSYFSFFMFCFLLLISCRLEHNLCLLSVYASGTPRNVEKKVICSSGKNEHGTAKFVNSFISLFLPFSLRCSENTLILALQGPGDKVTTKNHHPKPFWSSRDSLTNH